MVECEGSDSVCVHINTSQQW